MNKVILMGRLTRDPEVRYSQGENSTAIARYTLAVDRRFRRNNDGEQTADFIHIIPLLPAYASCLTHKNLITLSIMRILCSISLGVSASDSKWMK